MKRTLRFALFLGILAGISLVLPLAAAADGSTPSLNDVHQTLLKAAGYEADTPPTVEQQTALLNDARKMIHKIPHVYHAALNRADRAIEFALIELADGDKGHKAREMIFDADDQIKGCM